MNGVSSKFIPAVPEEDNSLETLTNKALNAMPTDAKWIDDAMSGDKMKISDLAKRALAKQFPPVKGGIQDQLNKSDEEEAEEIAMKEAEKIQNEETAATTKNAIEAEIGNAKEQLKKEVEEGKEQLKQAEAEIENEIQEKPKKAKKIDNRSAMEKAFDSAQEKIDLAGVKK